MSILTVKQKQLEELKKLYEALQYAMNSPSYKNELFENPSETPCIHALEAAYAVKVSALLDVQLITKEEIAKIELEIDDLYKKEIFETYQLQHFLIEVKGEGESTEQYKIIRFDEPYVENEEAVNEAVRSYFEANYLQNDKLIQEMLATGKTQALKEVSARVVDVRRIKKAESR